MFTVYVFQGQQRHIFGGAKTLAEATALCDEAIAQHKVSAEVRKHGDSDPVPLYAKRFDATADATRNSA
jgi:hypothetical protein